MNADQRRRVSGTFQRLHARYERLAFSRQSPFWKAVTSKVLADLRKAGVRAHVGDIFRPREWQRPFNQAMTLPWNSAAWAGVQFEQQWIEAHEPAEQAALVPVRQDIDPDNPLPPPSIRVEVSDDLRKSIAQFLRGRRVGVWGDVGRTVRNRLANAIRDGIKAGDDLDALEARLQGVLKKVSKYQARRIARTESTGSLNHGQQAERVELGIDRKGWVSTIDARTRGQKAGERFNHLSPDGQIVDNAAAFLISGEELLYPGDGSLGASAGNIIHCRCTAVAEF